MVQITKILTPVDREDKILPIIQECIKDEEDEENEDEAEEEEEDDDEDEDEEEENAIAGLS